MKGIFDKITKKEDVNIRTPNNELLITNFSTLNKPHDQSQSTLNNDNHEKSKDK